MSRFRPSLLSFGAGVAVVVAAIVFGDLRETVAAAVKATLVRDVDNAANYPYIGGMSPGYTNPTVPTTTLDGKPVKRAVIEFVSGGCNATLPSVVYEVSVGVTLDLGGGSAQNAHYTFPLTETTLVGGTNQLTAFSQPVRLYADPGTQLASSMGINNNGALVPTASCSLVFSGYLVTE